MAGAATQGAADPQAAGMESRDGWQALEGTELDTRVILRELRGVTPSPVFRAESSSGDSLLVRFWGPEHGDAATIVNRHREAMFVDSPARLQCFYARLAPSGEKLHAYAVFEWPDSLLADRLATSPLTLSEAQEMGTNLAEALDALHRKDLVYCALDPWTIARKDDRWLLADFSQLRLTGDEYRTETKRLFTMYPATPPEAFEGRVTAAWDAWSLAHVLRTGVLGPQRRRPGERPSEAASALPPPFIKVMSACTEVDPGRRCSVADIATYLSQLPEPAESVSAAAQPAAEPVVLSPSGARETFFRRVPVMIAVAVAIIAVVTILLLWRPGAASQSSRSLQVQQQPRPSIGGPLPSPLDNRSVDSEPASVGRMGTRARAAAEAGVLEVVDKWVATFRAQDVKGHMELYAPQLERFFLRKNVPAAQVWRIKRERLENGTEIRQYDIEGVQTRIGDDGRARVSFDKTYEFTGKSPQAGKVRSELVLIKVAENWRIISERDRRVLLAAAVVKAAQAELSHSVNLQHPAEPSEP